MINKINQHLVTILDKKLSGHQGTRAVIGWFYTDVEGMVAYGDFGLDDPATLSFQIGSVTKLFTASLVSIFINQDLLDLNKSIGSYLNLDAASSINQIVIEDLLTHHAGLPSAPKALLGKYDLQNPYQHVSKEKLAAYLNTYTQPFKTRKRFSYSNLGFSILGYMLEEILGKTYAELVQDEICQPLGLHGLWITRPEGEVNLAPGAIKKKQAVPRWDLNAFAPAGAIDANITDMLKFAKANLSGHPFYPRVEMCHQPRRTISKHLDIGLGWLISKHKDIGALHSHNGATGGFNSILGIHPKGQFGMVVLTNCSYSTLNLLGLAQDRATAIGFEGMKYLAKFSQNNHQV